MTYIHQLSEAQSAVPASTGFGSVQPIYSCLITPTIKQCLFQLLHPSVFTTVLTHLYSLCCFSHLVLPPHPKFFSSVISTPVQTVKYAMTLC
jgi:hypothetical protein